MKNDETHERYEVKDGVLYLPAHLDTNDKARTALVTMILESEYLGFQVYDIEVVNGNIHIVMNPDHLTDALPETRGSITWGTLMEISEDRGIEQWSREEIESGAQSIADEINAACDSTWLPFMESLIIDEVGSQCEGFSVSVEWAWKSRLMTVDTIMRYWKAAQEWNKATAFALKTVTETEGVKTFDTPATFRKEGSE